MTPGRERLLFGIRIAIWLVVGTCVIVFARRLDWDQVFGAFEGANLSLALLATAIGVPCVALQGLRWSSLVKAVRDVRRITPVAAMYVGQAASAFLPMRAGEAVRTELLARSAGISRAASLGTVALDHTVNGTVMFAFAGTLPLLLPVPRWMAIVLWAGMLGVVALGFVLLRLARHPESTPAGRFGRIVLRVRSGLAAARNPRAVAQAAGFAALSWIGEIAIAILALDAFGLPHDLPHAMVVLFGVNLALAIPSPPASLGNFELGAGSALVAFGGSTERAAAFAIGYHAMQLLPTLIMGGVMLPFFRKPKLAPQPPSLDSTLAEHA
ncbi:MAG: lysylphosphatidylglycerol synthase transmembrane domain-containing protein [Myxococcales bacterium]|nr:flippase-like domain-containing protein [Myxococcales bacterium]